MARDVLMVAFDFPPFTGSSGVQRTLRFCQYLPENEWTPRVMTVTRGAHERISADLDHEVPPHLGIHRAFALDDARHLSVRGRYLDGLALPDRWVTYEAAFEKVSARPHEARGPGPLQLVHSGLLYYSDDRNPSGFLDALALLVGDGRLTADDVHVTFRASGYDDIYQKMVDERDLRPLVTLAPSVPNEQALREMLETDGR